jgi:hypothetical protein
VSVSQELKVLEADFLQDQLAWTLSAVEVVSDRLEFEAASVLQYQERLQADCVHQEQHSAHEVQNSVLQEQDSVHEEEYSVNQSHDSPHKHTQLLLQRHRSLLLLLPETQLEERTMARVSHSQPTDSDNHRQVGRTQMYQCLRSLLSHIPKQEPRHPTSLLHMSHPKRRKLHEEWDQLVVLSLKKMSV